MKKTIATLVLLLVSASCYAATLPPPFSAKYEIKKGFVSIGYATRSFFTDKDKFFYVSDSKTTGVIAALFKERIIQTTQFQFDNNIVRPITYTYDRNKGKMLVEQSYDWQKGEVFSQRFKKSQNKIYEYEIPIGAQDQSSYQLALMIDLASGKRNFSYHIAENVRLMDYDVRHVGDRKLETIRGKLDTVVVQVKTKKVKITIWCAPKLHYLPVKIEHEEDGTSFEAVLTSLKGI